MQQQTDLWPPDVQTLEAFEHYAGLVQSRAFHMLTENWITGSAQEGMSHYIHTYFIPLVTALVVHSQHERPCCSSINSMTEAWVQQNCR